MPSFDGPSLELATIALSILAGVLLAALDWAITAFGEVRLLQVKEAPEDRLASVAGRIVDSRELISLRLLTGRVISLVVAVGLTVHLASQERWWVTALALGGVALIYVFLLAALGSVARARAGRWLLHLVRWLRPFELVLAVLSAPISWTVNFLRRTFPPPPAAGDQAVREVEHMIEQREESGSIPEDFAALLLSVLEFKDTVAREVMIPRTQMQAIELRTPLSDVLSMIIESGHSRYPVYRDRIDQIEGILYAKDLFRIFSNGTKPDFTLSQVLRRPVFFVAESHKIGQLLREMQARRFHLAVVLDEFGGVSGIVTLEDIVEEIVGEIRDEHDVEEPPIRQLDSGRWSVDASVSIYDLSEMLDADFAAEDGEYDSLGGLIIEKAGRVPEPGEVVESLGYRFLVQEADERHVTQVEISRPARTSLSLKAAGE